MNGQARTTTAERISFVVSAAVLLVLAGSIFYLWTQPREPAAPMVKQVGGTRVVDSRSYVTVEVRNAGDETAQAVQVTAELKLDGAVVVEGEQTIDFLSGGESEKAVFVFEDVPPTAMVELRVASFLQP
jgi:uncharacterized protein (TIGR02588 family)